MVRQQVKQVDKQTIKTVHHPGIETVTWNCELQIVFDMFRIKNSTSQLFDKL